MTLCFVRLNSSGILDGEIGDVRFKHQSEHDDIMETIKKDSHVWYTKGQHPKREELSPAFVAYVRHEIEKILVEALMGITLINDKYIVDADSLPSYCDITTLSDDDVRSNVAEAGSERDSDSDDEEGKIKGMHHTGQSRTFWSSDDGFPSYKYGGAESMSIATDTETDSLENEVDANEEEIEEPSFTFGDALDELDLDE